MNSHGDIGYSYYLKIIKTYFKIKHQIILLRIENIKIRLKERDIIIINFKYLMNLINI